MKKFKSVKFKHFVIPVVISKKPATSGFKYLCEFMFKTFNLKTQFIIVEKKMVNPQIIAIFFVEFLTQETNVVEKPSVLFDSFSIFSSLVPIEDKKPTTKKEII